MQKTFDTPGPTSVYVALGSGDLSVRAQDLSLIHISEPTRPY